MKKVKRYNARKCEICSVRKLPESKVFLSSFPIDPIRCRKWVQVTGNEDLVHLPIEKLHELKFLCNSHFAPHFVNEKGNRLISSAVPTENLTRPPLSDGAFIEFPYHVSSFYDKEKNKPALKTTQSKNLSNVQHNNAEETRIAELDYNIDNYNTSLSISSDVHYFEDEISNDSVNNIQNQEKPLLIEVDDTTINKENKNVNNKIVVKAQVGRSYKVEYVNNQLRLVDYCPDIISNKNVDVNKLNKDSVQIDNVNEVNCNSDAAETTNKNNDNKISSYNMKQNVHTQDPTSLLLRKCKRLLKPVKNKLRSKNSKPEVTGLYLFDGDVFTTDKNKIYIPNEDLAAFKKGEDIIMLTKKKYAYFKKFEKIKSIQGLVKELRQLRHYKEQIQAAFASGVIITVAANYTKRSQWTDQDMEKAAFIRQNVGNKMYSYLKYHMRYRLPRPKLLRQWMIDNKLIDPKKKCNEDTPQDASQMVEENEQVQESGGVSEMHTAQVQSEDQETAQAIGSIAQVEHNQHLYIQNQTENAPMELNDGMDNYLDPTLNEVIIPQSDTTKIRKKHVDVNLRCQLCIKYFETEVQVRQHVPLHYYNTHYTNYLDAQPPFQCEFCGDKVKTRPLLVVHHRSHLGITNFRCRHPGCSFVTDRVPSLTEHARRHRSSFQCELCAAKFPLRQLLSHHRNTQHSAQVKRRCRLCSAVTLNDFTFRRHMRAHTRPPKLKCTEPGCMEAFYSSVERRRHRMTHLSNEEDLPFKCPHCPHAAYPKMAMLSRHMKRHKADKMNTCMKCGQIFYDYGAYYEHRATQHQRRPRLQCACSRSFQYKKKLDIHQLQCEFVKKNCIDDRTTELQAEGSTNVTQEHSQDDKSQRKRSKKQITVEDNHLENKKLRKNTEDISATTQIIETNIEHVEHEVGGEDATLSMSVIIDGTVPSDVITMTLEEYQQYLLSTQENSEEYGSLNVDVTNVNMQH